MSTRALRWGIHIQLKHATLLTHCRSCSSCTLFSAARACICTHCSFEMQLSGRNHFVQTRLVKAQRMDLRSSVLVWSQGSADVTTVRVCVCVCVCALCFHNLKWLENATTKKRGDVLIHMFHMLTGNGGRKAGRGTVLLGGFGESYGVCSNLVLPLLMNCTHQGDLSRLIFIVWC